MTIRITVKHHTTPFPTFYLQKQTAVFNYVTECVEKFFFPLPMRQSQWFLPCTTPHLRCARCYRQRNLQGRRAWCCRAGREWPGGSEWYPGTWHSYQNTWWRKTIGNPSQQSEKSPPKTNTHRVSSLRLSDSSCQIVPPDIHRSKKHSTGTAGGDANYI